MTRFANALDRALSALLVVLMCAMVLVVTWQVATRYLLGSPSSYTEELSTFLLIWMSLLGAAYALRVGAHLGIDVVVRRLAPAQRRRTRAIVYGVIIVFCLVTFVYGGGRLVYVTLHLAQRSAAFQVPMGYVYLILPLSGLLMIFYSLVGLFDLRRTSEDPSSPAAPTA